MWNLLIDLVPAPLMPLVFLGIIWFVRNKFASYPFVDCGKCNGSGRRYGGGRAYKHCDRCSGTGERFRLGHHFFCRKCTHKPMKKPRVDR